MTTRRTFLHLSLAATSATSAAVALPQVARGQGRTFEIRPGTAPALREGYRRFRPCRRDDPRLAAERRYLGLSGRTAFKRRLPRRHL
jgi:hypothetical protein